MVAWLDDQLGTIMGFPVRIPMGSSEWLRSVVATLIANPVVQR